MTRRLKLSLALTTAASVVLAACATEPATGAPAGMSASDRRLGAQEHPKILQEFGGPYNGPGLSMVTRVGRQMALQSGIASTGNECTVTLLNSTVVNAFAIPGCYIYVTRGLLSIMNDEAELASVLGHEIGHVAARHAQRRQQASTLSGLGALLLGIFTGSGQLAQLAGQAAQLYTLKFSRSQEYQADDLGIQYMTKAGYDPYASADMLESLEDESQLEMKIRGVTEAQQMPAWARTHPLTSDRINRATAQAKKTGVAPNARARNRDQYMAAIDGMLYGDDPTQGYVDGQTFAHPTLKLSFRAPPNFYLNNSTAAVTAQGPNGVQAQFSGGKMPSGAGLDDYMSQVLQGLFGQAQGVQLGNLQRTTVNGMETAVIQARAPTQSGSADVRVAAYRWSPTEAFHIIMISPSNVNASGQFDTMMRSFRRLSDSEAAALRPRILDVVTVKAGDTLQSLANRMAVSNHKLETFLTINDRESNEPLRPGEKVKLVVVGSR